MSKNQQQYSPEEEQRLMSVLWSPMIKDSPLSFVMYAFPWGEKGKPLENQVGPRKWQRKVLRKIEKHIKEGKAINLPKLMRLARASGRGIGKSALVAWLVLWFISTRIGATAIISANTEDQLRGITFAEIAKWHTMSINCHWFDLTGIVLNPAGWLKELVEKQLSKGTKYWGAEGKLWSAEKPDAYAGPHNHDGMMVIFDEASGIVDQIWTVANGFFTEPTFDRFWFAFSQMRRNSGRFFECFNHARDYWDTDQIDARTVEGTDPTIYKEIIEEHGEDSDEARVEVYGLAPNSDEASFVPASFINDAVKREIKDDKTAPIVIGVDPAGGGADTFCIVIRQGRVILEILRYKLEDSEIGTMEGVGHVINAIDKYKPALTVVDETGMGGPIGDRLREQKYKIRKVLFSWKSGSKRYGNKRAEMWASMKKWLQTGSIPDDKRLKTDLGGPNKKPDSKGTMFLESKRDMKARKLASPDSADALAVTFAFPVAHRDGMLASAGRTVVRTNDHASVPGSWMAL